MLTLNGLSHRSFCDRVARREFLSVGSLALGGLSLPDVLRAEDKANSSSSDRAVVMVYLPGGPTQHETFDPKSNAPVEIRGSYGPISTQVPGVQFCELLPELAASSHRFSIVRSLVGMKNRHESFQCYTGRPGGRAEDAEPSGGWPTLGAVASWCQGGLRDGTVPYVDVSPPMAYRPYRNLGLHNPSGRVSWPGFTGQAHTPFALKGDVKSNLTLNGVNLLRFDDRRSLLSSLNRTSELAEAAGLDNFQKQAFGILTSSRLAEALDLSREDPRLVERYGEAQKTDPSFGGAPQSAHHLLLARRLVEAGVKCVTVAFGAWDWHANREGPIDQLSKKYLPVFDHALAVFLEDLDDRGLLESVSVVVWGEFGRTPRINAKGGRDHWPNTQSVLLAGGGIQGGRVIGETDRSGGVPASRPVHVQEVFATLYNTLGIDVNSVKIPDFNGRPRYLVDDNHQPISELLS